MTLPELLRILEGEGRIQPDSTLLPPDVPNDNAWYIRTLLGMMGWLGGVLIVGSFAAAVGSLLREQVLMLAFAGIFITVAWFLYRTWGSNDFAAQFALAASMAGQILFVFGMARNGHEREIAFFLAALQCALVFLMPNFLHRFLSMCFAIAALWFALGSRTDFLPSLNEAPVALTILVTAGFTLLAASESTWRAAKRSALLEPVMLACAVMSLVVHLPHVALIGKFSAPPSMILAILLTAVLIAWSGWVTLNQEIQYRLMAAVGLGIFGLACWRAPGVIAGVLVMLIAFSRGLRVLMCVAMVAILMYLSALYYQLGQTLADKALALALTAGALLLMRAAVAKLWPKAAA